METYKRICINDLFINNEGKTFILEKGKEYITSSIKNDRVTVYDKYWVTNIPIQFFKGEDEFTNDKYTS